MEGEDSAPPPVVDPPPSDMVTELERLFGWKESIGEDVTNPLLIIGDC